MLLETSFCGTKPPKVAKASAEESGTKTEGEDLEKVLLSRKHDPTEAILAEGTTSFIPISHFFKDSLVLECTSSSFFQF